MRNIINISLPASMVQSVREEVKSGGFASISEYIRHVIRAYKEERLYQDVMKSRKEFKQGKFKVLKSLRDLR